MNKRKTPELDTAGKFKKVEPFISFKDLNGTIMFKLINERYQITKFINEVFRL